MRYVLAASVGLQLAVLIQASAADLDGHFDGYGAKSCAEVNTVVQDERAARARATSPEPAAMYSLPYQRIYFFVAGYITATNRLLPDTQNIVPSGGAEAVMQWIANWCSADPTRSLLAGLIQFEKFAYPNRKR